MSENTVKKHEARNDRPEPGIEWFWVEMQAAEMARDKAEAAKKGYGKHGFAIYCALCLLARKAYSDHKTTIMAGAKTIGAVAGLSKNTASRIIQILRETELLTVSSGGINSGKNDHSNVYTLHYTKTPTGSNADPSGGRPGTQQGHQAKGRKYSSPSGKEYLSSERTGKAHRRSRKRISADADPLPYAMRPVKETATVDEVINSFYTPRI